VRRPFSAALIEMSVEAVLPCGVDLFDREVS
jgi:hypothetical protein